MLYSTVLLLIVSDSHGRFDGCTGSVKVWDPRQKGSPVACMEPAEGETRRDCWCVAFGNSFSDVERCVCAGYDNGDVKMFDLRTMTQRWETNIKNGVRIRLCF